jgi:hypothetical protein
MRGGNWLLGGGKLPVGGTKVPVGSRGRFRFFPVLRNFFGRFSFYVNMMEMAACVFLDINGIYSGKKRKKDGSSGFWIGVRAGDGNGSGWTGWVARGMGFVKA